MRFLAILLLLTLSYLSAEALEEQQLQEDHAGKFMRISWNKKKEEYYFSIGYCPMHKMICMIYCPPDSINSLAQRMNNGCNADNECAVDEKCCKPACGCTHKCTKALEKPGFDKVL